MLGTRYGIFLLLPPVAVVAYGSLTFREEHRLRTFEKRALSKMFRPNKEKIARA
jgi:hypothetical protein